MAPSEFWQQTPASYGAVMAGVRERLDTEFKLHAQLTRANAIWSQMEPRRIPSIDKLMHRKGDRPLESDLAANARAWITILKAQQRKGG